MQSNPVQRCWRDVHAISSHVVMNWDVPAENFGRMELRPRAEPGYPAFGAGGAGTPICIVCWSRAEVATTWL